MSSNSELRPIQRYIISHDPFTGKAIVIQAKPSVLFAWLPRLRSWLLALPMGQIFGIVAWAKMVASIKGKSQNMRVEVDCRVSGVFELMVQR